MQQLLGQPVDWLDVSEFEGSQDAHEDGLVVGAAAGAVSAPDFAVDHGVAYGVFAPPVGGVGVFLPQVGEYLAGMAEQEVGQAFVGDIGLVRLAQRLDLAGQSCGM